MNKKLKKIIMIVLLIIFIVVIGVILININKKSNEKINNSNLSNNTVNTTIAESNITTTSTSTIVASTNTSTTNNTTENINNTIENIGSTTTSENIRKGTKKVTADTKNMLEIGDSYFIQATNDVYVNLNTYIGKTIKVQGLIYSYKDNNGDICYAVVRRTPGCCGADGLAGLDIRYDGEYPEDNTWVTVIGVVDTDNVFGNKIPAIQVTSLEKTETGVTFVSN